MCDRLVEMLLADRRGRIAVRGMIKLPCAAILFDMDGVLFGGERWSASMDVLR